MDHVLILMRGEDHQGGSVRGVFASNAAGIGEADRIIDEIRERDAEIGIPWERDRSRDSDPSVIRAFRGGCDWMRLVSHEVRG